MPLALTYPGVYVEEIPSGVRTIVGVATSITAFVGRAVRGPVNEPWEVDSSADCQRALGGIGARYPMSYAIKDFFMNGGARALIVRLFQPPDTATGVAQLTVAGLTLVAASPGE